MKYARIVNSAAIDVRTESPDGCFTPNIAAQFIEVPEGVENGWTLSGETWSPPAVPEPVDPTPVGPIPPAVGPIHFKMLFSSPERIAAKSLRSTDEGVDDFWSLLEDPRTTVVDLSLYSVQCAVEYTLTKIKAAGVDIDVQARKAWILSGVLV